jgi:hypothetical protein
MHVQIVSVAVDSQHDYINMKDGQQSIDEHSRNKEASTIFEPLCEVCGEIEHTHQSSDTFCVKKHTQQH